MAKPRTKEFYVCHWRGKEQIFVTNKVRGYVRVFSATETGHQIAVGIHHAGNGWDCVELTTGLRIVWEHTLSEAFNYFQDDHLIERVWNFLNEDNPGKLILKAKATIAAIKD